MHIIAFIFIVVIIAIILLVIAVVICIHDLYVIHMNDKITKKHNLTKAERKHLVKELSSRSTAYEED